MPTTGRCEHPGHQSSLTPARMTMTAPWPPLPEYHDWQATCDTSHGHTQVLGKLSAALAPAEAGFGHLALRLTARGWETPCGDRSALRGLPVIVRGVSGTAPGTDPLERLLWKERQKTKGR